MKTISLYLVLLIGGVWCFSSCFNDKSSALGSLIADVIIDTTGIPEQHSVVQYERLKIAPHVYQEGVNNPDLSYKWMLNLIATTDQNSVVASYCVGEKMTLDTIIELRPNSIPYYLWFQVTDNKTKLRRDLLWKVQVLQAYNEGLLIAETHDGTTTDFSLIEGNLFTKGWTKEDKVSKNLYSTRNGSKIDGLLKQIAPSYNAATQSKRFYCIGDDFYTLIDGLDYTLVGRNHEITYDKELPIKPTQIFISGGNYVILVTDGQIYPWNMGLRKDYPNIHVPNSYSLQIGEEQVRKRSTVDQYVAYIHQYGNSNYAWGAWYDKINGAFCYQLSYPSVQSGIAAYVYDDTQPFNPANASGLETMYAGTGFNNDFYFIMKNTNISTYQIYVFSRTTNKAKALYNIPGNKMDEAVSFIVSENANVCYFATETEIYSVVLGGASPQVNLIHTIPSGEITCFTMFRQALFLRTNSPTLDINENLLLVGVANDNEGTLYTLPIFSPSGGTIDPSGIKTYTGFGRILTVTSQE